MKHEWRRDGLSWLALNPSYETLNQTEARLRVIVPKLDWVETAERLWKAGERQLAGGAPYAVNEEIDAILALNARSPVQSGA